MFIKATILLEFIQYSIHLITHRFSLITILFSPNLTYQIN
jgi:hypothetical protein